MNQDLLKKFNIKKDDCLLLVIDIQDKLSKAMFDEDMVKNNTKKLLEFANIFSIPVIFTEQNPKSLGSTSEQLKQICPNSDFIAKMEFSAYNDDIISLLKKYNKNHIIIVGIEAHVCVFQSSRDLLANGYSVTLISDATASRTQKNYLNALDLMSKMGAVISNTETVIFDILQTSTNPNFKQAQALIK